MKKHQTNMAIGKPYGMSSVVNRGTDFEYRVGRYDFNQGTVTFYSEPKLATFSFSYKGRIHGLSLSDIKAPLTERQLIVRAGKFGRSVVADF